MREIKEFKIQKAFEITGLYTAFGAKYEKNYFFDGETHDFWEIVCAMGGNVGITAGKYVYSLKKGECFIHRPMEFHRIWAEDDKEIEVAIFTFACNNMIKGGYGQYSLQAKEMKKIKELIDVSNRIFNKTKDNEIIGVKENMEQELYIFVNELENLLLNIFKVGNALSGIVENSTSEKYTMAIRVMEDNIDKRLSVDDIANLCKVSVPNLKKIFKKYSGGGVMEYFGNMKIKAAKSFLKEGKSVKETAYMLGFYDQNYFNVFFKRYTGISPGKFS